MKLPVTLYKSTDVGAPQLDNTVTGFINVLKKCLVDGYGTKAGLGWSLDFEDVINYKAVFRNSTLNGGSGGYCQFMPAIAGSNTSSTLWFKAANYMGGIDGWVNPQPLRSFFINTSGYNGWVLIGTSRGFYFQRLYDNQLNHAAQNQYSNALFVGDIHSFHEPDLGCFAATANQQSSDDTSPSSGDGVANLRDSFSIGKLIDVDGGGTAVEYETFGCGYTYFNAGGDDLKLDPPSLNLTMRVCEVSRRSQSDVDRFGTRCTVSSISPYVRGKLPGVLLIRDVCICKNITYPHTPTIGGESYYPIINASGVGIWVNTGYWYD
ncbi:MAG: hypothetical protein V7690_05250 [Shewanella sp.]|jgi:hypothetical protein|uniref:hypothetical protein n=1 Tax=Shewanella sp. TaxID=50422 RepID=UPI0030015B68